VVEEHDVGWVDGDTGARARECANGADHLDVRLLGQCERDARRHHLVVVHDEDSDRPVIPVECHARHSAGAREW